MSDSVDDVLEAAQKLVDSISDGTLTVVRKETVEGREVWSIRHAPAGVDPAQDLGMTALRKGKITVLEVEGGQKAYEVEIYGGTEGIMRDDDGAWSRVHIQAPQMDFSDAAVMRLLGHVRKFHPGFLCEEMNQLSHRGIIAQGVDSETHRAMTLVISLSPQGHFEEVRDVTVDPEDDPSPF